MKNGFTLVELIISMFIIIVLATMVTIAFGYNQQHKTLVAQGQMFLNVLKETQAKALVGVKNPATNSVPDGGWGVQIKETQYYIFADNNANAMLDLGETIINGDLAAKNVRFKNAQTDIVFLPYKATDSVCWNKVCADAAVKIVTLENSQSGEPFLIYVDPTIGKVFTE
jgi:prepilin-type N-terminal cleavage/methylation domain-containing protein